MKTIIEWDKVENAKEGIPYIAVCCSGAVYLAWKFDHKKIKDIYPLNLDLGMPFYEKELNGWYEYFPWFNTLPKKIIVERIEYIIPVKNISESLYPKAQAYGEVEEELKYILESGDIYTSSEYNSSSVHIVDKEDVINHPSHYNHGRVETIDFIEDSLGKEGLINYCLGNVLKYISRANFKGKHDEDIKKAYWYLGKAISVMEENKNE